MDSDRGEAAWKEIMSKPIFTIVDVFAERRYAGNQLAVFRHTEGLSDVEMQSIAKETNFSETTFILSDKQRNGGYDVRIFTPAREVPFAGHPTLGTAFVLQRDVVGRAVGEIRLNLAVGRIPVSIHYVKGQVDRLQMKQNAPDFGEVFPAEKVAEFLSLAPDELDTRYPVQDVSTGLPFMIVPVKSLESMRKARVVRDAFFRMVENSRAKAPLLFCPETYHEENDLNVRVFVDYYDIPEDPATGSGNGCLAGYLAKHRYFGGNEVKARVEQGYEIGRPSLLFLEASGKGEKIEVRVGGRVVPVAEGEWG